MKKSNLLFLAIIFMACSLAVFGINKQTRSLAAADTTQSVATTQGTTQITTAPSSEETTTSQSTASGEATQSTDTTNTAQSSETTASTATPDTAKETTTATTADSNSFVRGAYYKMIDSHLHYLDYIQETDGFEALVKEMDKNNISHAVVFGMPLVKQWDEHAPNEPKGYLSNDSRTYYFSATDYMMMQDYLSLPEETQKRFFPFVCGVNPNDKNAAKHLRKVLEDYKGKFYGIGELISRNDDLSAFTYGEPPRADHPAFKEIYDLAAEYKMPVIVHHNVTAFNIPDPIYLGEMKNALAHNRNTNIIWAHTGASKRADIANLPAITEQMLSENSNLYCDLSDVVFDKYINKDENSLNTWTALIEKYPDRFIIGSNQTGKWQDYNKQISKYYPLLEKLSDSTVQKVCTDNLLKLINVDKNTLS